MSLLFDFAKDLFWILDREFLEEENSESAQIRENIRWHLLCIENEGLLQDVWQCYLSAYPDYRKDNSYSSSDLSSLLYKRYKHDWNFDNEEDLKEHVKILSLALGKLYFLRDHCISKKQPIRLVRRKAKGG